MPSEFIDLSSVDLNDTFEPEVLEDGAEVQLVITSMLIDDNKNGDRYMMPFFDVVDNPTVADINDYMELPHDRMAPKDMNNAKLKIQNFGVAFGIDWSSQLDIKNDVVGQTGWAILNVKKDRDKNPVNGVRKYVTGA